jgi:hypothetical protein
VIDVAGGFGCDLAAKGDAAMIDFALSWLSGLYGIDVGKAVKLHYGVDMTAAFNNCIWFSVAL